MRLLSFFSQFTEDSPISSQENTSDQEYESILNRQKELFEQNQALEYQILIYQQELSSLKREKAQIELLI